MDPVDGQPRGSAANDTEDQEVSTGDPTRDDEFELTSFEWFNQCPVRPASEEALTSSSPINTRSRAYPFE
jgi:hypothetical protein